MGAEKFFDIKCRVSGLRPDAAVLVATVRALKMHSGRTRWWRASRLIRAWSRRISRRCRKAWSISSPRSRTSRFGVPCVVCINRFPADTPAEIALIREVSLQAGAFAAVPSTHFVDGGAGAAAVCEAVAAAAEQPNQFHYLYPLNWPIKQKIETIATQIYGADTVYYEPAAEKKIRLYSEGGFTDLPICMAKTHLSLSHDPKLIGRPQGYQLPIRDVNLSAGAGFIYPLCGEMRTMPGLGSEPGGRISILMPPGISLACSDKSQYYLTITRA